MKKIGTMMLMLFVACMGMALQSCGSDDDSSEKASYTLSGSLTDKGNLPDEAAAVIQATISQASETIVATLSNAKSRMDQSINASKSAFPTAYNYTITFYLKDSAGKVQYTKRLVVKDQKITIE